MAVELTELPIFDKPMLGFYTVFCIVTVIAKDFIFHLLYFSAPFAQFVTVFLVFVIAKTVEEFSSYVCEERALYQFQRAVILPFIKVCWWADVIAQNIVIDPNPTNNLKAGFIVMVVFKGSAPMEWGDVL